MTKSDLLARINYCIFIGHLTVFNGKRFNECSRISTGKNKAYFLYVTMKYIAALLSKPVCKNRKSCNIAALNKELGITALFCIIEFSVGVNALGFVFEKRMSKYIVSRVMSVIPYNRNRVTIVFLERISHDSSSV